MIDGARIGPLRYFAAAAMGLAGAGLFTTQAFAEVAYVMDDAFRMSAGGVARSLADGDMAGALQGARVLSAGADQPFEKYTSGQLMLQAAAAKGDLQAQRQALDLMLESGAAPSGRTAELHALAGIISAMLGDYRTAATQIAYANRLGYVSVPSQVALADAAFQTGNAQVGNAALEQAIAIRVRGGQRIEAEWYDRAIALSYRYKRPDLLALWTQRKLATYPSPQNWRSGIVNVMTGAALGPEQSLDLYRLMAVTQALAGERDWQAYSALATQQESFVEAKAVLDKGSSSGTLNRSDATVQKELALLTPKARKALANLPALEKKARAAGGGAQILAAADTAFGVANDAIAVALYRLALQKGGIDTARANTRLGIALARTGDLAGGRAALAQVNTGPWAPVAGLWSIWIEGRTPRSAD